MANTPQDGNRVSGLIAASNVDQSAVPVWVDPTTHRLLCDVIISNATVVGNKSNNAGAPGANNLGVLPAIANAAAPSYTEGNQVLLSTDLSGNLRVTGSLTVGGTTDNSAYTAGTSTGTPSMGFYHSVIDTVTDGRAAALAMTSKRALMVNLQNSSGTEIGTAATPVQVSLANTATNATAIKVDGSAVTQPISGTVTANAGTGSFTVAQATAANLNAQVQGAAASGAAKSGNPLQIGAVFNTTQPTVTTGQAVEAQATARGAQIVATGADTFNVTVNAALPAGTNLLGKVGIDQTTVGTTNAVSLAQIGATTVSTGNGISGAGVQRVNIASDNTAFSVNAIQSATWTVQPGNTANTTPWLVSQTPATAGGLSTFHLVAAASTNATNIKASAGQVYGWFIYNSNAAARKVAFHNNAGTPTAGAAVIFSLVIPPNAGANVSFDSGIPFATGIAITTVTGLADTDATAVALNDLIINIFYK